MAYSIEHLRLNAVKSWKEQTGKDFVFTWKASKFITHWKRLSANSVNSLELMERPSVVTWRQGRLRFFSNCHPTFKPMQTAFPPFSACFHLRGVTASNSVIPVGIRHESCACSRRKTYRFASPTTMTRRHHGNARRTSSMFEATGPEDDTKDTTPRMRWRAGPNGSGHGRRKGCDVFVFFDNDQKSAAPIDALKLKQICCQNVRARSLACSLRSLACWRLP